MPYYYTLPAWPSNWRLLHEVWSRGNEVRVGPDGGFIRHVLTGETIKIRREKGGCVLDVDILPGFMGQDS